MLKNKKVMIVAHFCDFGEENSNNRFNYLADFLGSHGYEVELVTSSFSHRDKVQRIKKKLDNKKYKTTLIYEPSYQKNISLKRLFISHYIMAKNLHKYLNECDCPDILYCSIPSINVAEVVSKYAEKNSIPLVLDVQDLWPEAYRLILKQESLYHFATRSMKKRVNKVYRAADQIIAVSDTYAERAKSVNKKCDTPITIYLGTERAIFERAIKNCSPKYSKPDNEFWIGYCGTLGHSYDLVIVMEAMKYLAKNRICNIRFVVIGSGPLEKKFKQKAKELGISCIFTGKLPYDQMCAQLNQCDIAVNPITKGAAQSIINKHADYAIAGLPVVNTQKCEEYCDLLKKYNCGINCEPDSVEQIAKAILLFARDKTMCMIMRENARKMGVEKFERSNTYGEILQVIQKLLKDK